MQFFPHSLSLSVARFDAFVHAVKMFDCMFVWCFSMLKVYTLYKNWSWTRQVKKVCFFLHLTKSRIAVRLRSTRVHLNHNLDLFELQIDTYVIAHTNQMGYWDWAQLKNHHQNGKINFFFFFLLFASLSNDWLKSLSSRYLVRACVSLRVCVYSGIVPNQKYKRETERERERHTRARDTQILKEALKSISSAWMPIWEKSFHVQHFQTNFGEITNNVSQIQEDLINCIQRWQQQQQE